MDSVLKLLLVLTTISASLASLPVQFSIRMESVPEEKILDQESIKFLEQDTQQFLTDMHGQKFEFGRLLSDVDDMYEPEDLVGTNFTCDVCKSFVKEVQRLAKLKDAEKLIVDFATEYCKLKKIQDDRVCEMMVREYKDVFMYVFTHGQFVPDEMCGRFMGSICPPYDGPWWNVTLPPKPDLPLAPRPPHNENPSTVKFLMLSDIHMDFQYLAGMNPDCGEPICCREPGGKHKAGVYGDPKNCDAAPAMVESLFKQLHTISDQFDYAIFTGDAPAHDVWNQTTTANLAHVQYLAKMFATYLPTKPVFYTAGNHEGFPVNTFPPPGYPFTMDWLYQPLEQLWGKWLDAPARETIRTCGGYSYSPFPGFRIISINSNYANNLNFFLILNSTDPCGALTWMVSELTKAEQKGEKVHVLTHIPNKGTMKPWSWNYYAIVDRFQDTITNIFNGHSHKDWFQVYYGQDDTTPSGVAFIGPAASGHSDIFPSYRIYTMDGNYTGSSWSVLDLDNFYLNVTRANLEGSTVWEESYNPKTSYNMTGLTPRDYNDLVSRMDKDDDLFQLFHKHYNAMYPVGDCTGKCKTKMLKELRKARK